MIAHRSSKNPNWGLGGFDLDGTLVHGSTVLLHVGQRLGQFDLVEELVCGYESFKMTNEEVSNEAAKMFQGLTRRQLMQLLNGIPRLRDIERAIGLMRRADIRSAIATITFEFASQWFAKRYGFDAYSGIELEFGSEGTATGRVRKHVSEYDKVEFLASAADRYQVERSQVFYVGDSRSDLPAFDFAAFSVAINASEEARERATTCVNSDSLLDVVRVVPGLADDLSWGS